MGPSHDSPGVVNHSESSAAPPTAADRPSSNHSALLIVFLVVVIDLLGFGIVLPLLPRYGREFLEPMYPGEVHAVWRGALLGLLMSSFSLMQFLVAPLWGRLSDRTGRRPILLIGLAGSVIFYTLFGIASEMGMEGQYQLGLILLFVARIGAGVAGATLGTAQAVIADSTSQEGRARGMALIGMAFGIGFAFGPLLGLAALVFLPDVRGGPGYAAAAFSLMALLLGWRMLPETWRPGAGGGRRHWLNWDGLRSALRTPTVGMLMIIFFLSTLAFANFEPTLALLTRDLLAYEDQQNFLIFSYVGLILGLAQGFYRPLAKRGVQEMPFMLLGAGLMIVGLGALGYEATLVDASNPAGNGHLLPYFLVALAIAVTGFAFLTPSVQSLVSRRSDPAKQGEILGVNQSINALARILGPMFGVGLYVVTPAHVGPYIFAAGLLLLAMVLMARIRKG